MRDWFTGLAPRERIMVIVGAVAVVIGGFYMLIWEPLQIGHRNAVDDVQRKQALVANAQRVLPAPGADASAGRGPQQSLILLVTSSAASSGLNDAYKSSSPAGTGGLRVSMEQASFDDLVQWLGVLQREHGVRVTSGSITGRSDVGRVDASLVVERQP